MFCMPTYRWPKLMWGLFIFELGPTVALLALFGIASPDLYRSDMWEYGNKKGWNSSPQQLLYAAANHESISAPLPWSQFITTFNLVISVLSMFLLLTKVTMHIMGIFWPIVSVFLHAALTALYAYSVYGQSAPDNSDPKHPTNGPCWYITEDCNVAPGSLAGYCKQAKSAFIVTIIMLALFAFHMIFAAACCKGSPEARQKYEERKAEKAADKAFEKQIMAEKKEALSQAHQWELHSFPQTPGTAGAMKSPYAAAYTPRTQAFSNLGGMPSPQMQYPSSPQMHYPTSPQLVRSGTGGTSRSGSAGGSVTNYSRELPLRSSQEMYQDV